MTCQSQYHDHIERPRPSIFACALTVVWMIACIGCTSSPTPPEPSNRVVLMIDGSGSYKSRQVEAVKQAVALLDTLAHTKLRRWESAPDTIVLISLDAMPDVLWQGSLRDLKAIEPDAWTARFEARTDYISCTDIEAAFKLATHYLTGDSRYVKKYLFAWTDLIDEPPTNSIKTCGPPHRLPPENFPWEGLRDVSVSVFWVPAEQKLVWGRAVQEHGLEASFALSTTSESAEVMINPPPRPTVEVTEAERTAVRKRLLSQLVVTGGLIVGSVILLIGLIVLIASLVQRWRRPLPLRPPVVRNPRALPSGSRRPIPPPRPMGFRTPGRPPAAPSNGQRR